MPLRPLGNTARSAATSLFGPSSIRLFLAGFCALCAGTSVYVFVRQGGVLLLPAEWQFGLAVPYGLAVVFGSLPTFCHVLAFSLMSAAVAGGRHRLCTAAIVWCLINLVFEAGQRTDALSGTFDVNDCVAAAVPAALFLAYGKGKSHE